MVKIICYPGIKHCGSCPACVLNAKNSKSTAMPGYTPESLAEKFHALYEDFATDCGYKTRDESAVPWADVPDKNKKLMVRVCRAILKGA